jgi:quercetin dioxygenase-like cupin family protein
MRHVLIGAFCILAAGMAVSQTGQPASKVPLSTDGTDPKTWDPQTFAPQAAPGNHKVVFEDADMRVMSVTVPRGSEEPYHAHPYYSILLLDEPAKIVDRDINGNKAPDVMLDKIDRPFIFVQPPQALHSIKNLDVKDAHLIRIEFKRPGAIPKFLHMPWEKTGQMPISSDGTDPRTWDSKAAAPTAAPSFHKVIYESDIIRVMSVTGPVGGQEPYHTHPYPSLLVFATPSMSSYRDKDGKPSDARLPFVPIAFLQPPQGMHSMKNLGDTPVHAIRIEFKRGL